MEDVHTLRKWQEARKCGSEPVGGNLSGQIVVMKKQILRLAHYGAMCVYLH